MNNMKQSIYLDEISPFRYRYSPNDPEASLGHTQIKFCDIVLSKKSNHLNKNKQIVDSKHKNRHVLRTVSKLSYQQFSKKTFHFY